MHMFLKLEMKLTAENITTIRHFLITMLAQGITNEQQAHEIAMASTEILENVSKFSVGGGVVIDMQKQLNLSKIIFTVKNITTEKNFNTFKTILSSITQGTSDEAYRKMMLRSVNNKDISQLGLARIRHECNAEINYSMSKDITELQGTGNNIPDKEDLLVLGVIVQIPIKK